MLDRAQFRILYRQFLFRMIDLELLSVHGDVNRLLGQFAGLLAFFSAMLGFGGMMFDTRRMTPQTVLLARWGMEHFMIATTMLVVGLFAVLAWDSMFPDRRDVLILTPLPIRASTLFLAKVAALAATLSLTVVSLHVFTSLPWSLVMMPDHAGLLGLIRSFAAYWITMFAAGAFIFCSVLAVQGIAAQLLPRRRFLRVSAFLQLAAFCLFVCGYFLEPSLATPRDVAAPENQRALAWLPTYWFLGLFQTLNGSAQPATAALAARAWAALAIAIFVSCTAFLLAYFRTLRKIVEEPDIAPGSRSLKWLPRFGDSLETAIVRFSIRTLMRSRQHRMMLAFYLGIGFSLTILFMQAPAQQQRVAQAALPLLFSNVVIMSACIIGTRIVFSMPLALPANWIFRITEIRGAREYLSAIRRPLFVLAVAPVWIGSAALFFSIWPWRRGAEHLAILGLWGVLLAYLSLYSFRKIPFTCSYLPGKSQLHIAFLAGLAFLFFLGWGVDQELRALEDRSGFTLMLSVLAAAAILARWRAVAQGKSDGAIVQFEEAPVPAIQVLGL